MNLNRLLLLTILLPSAFVVGIVLLSYLPHTAELLTHQGEHILLGAVIIAGIIPFSFFVHYIFRRIQRHMVQQNQELARRSAEMEALLRVSRAAEKSLELEQLLRSTLEEVVSASNAQMAEIWLREERDGTLVLRHHQGAALLEATRLPLGQGYPGIVAQTGKPLLLHKMPQDSGLLGQPVKEKEFQSLYVLPLHHSGKVIGVLAVASRDAAAFTSEDELRLLSLMSDHVSMAIENARLHQEVKTLAILTERERIAREMHDGLAQVLGYVNTKAQAVKELLKAGQAEAAAAQMEQLESAARDTYDDVREAILALGSDSRDRPLLESLQSYASRWSEFSDLPVEVIAEGNPSLLPPEVEVQLLRIVQEALANVRKHAHASRARLVLSFQPAGCRLIVEDNGQGFDPERLPRRLRAHRGLQSMRERASAIGARFLLDSAPGKGTRVIIELPRPAE